MERTFGWLEQHCNGTLLDTVETVLHFAETLTFKGSHPVVTLVEKGYKTGGKLTQLRIDLPSSAKLAHIIPQLLPKTQVQSCFYILLPNG